MTGKPRRLAVVVVNYGSHGLLRENLVPVSRRAAEAVTVVVDNPTTEAERSAVRDLALEHGWELVESSANVGFGAGVNLGVERAQRAGADLFLILNPDATIDAASLDLLIETIEREPMALVVPRGRRTDGRSWPTAHSLDLERGRLTPSSRLTPEERDAQWQWVSAACLLTTQEVWSAIGGFDPDYFLYWEDIDLSYRAAARGAKLIVHEQAVATHDEGGTQTGAAAAEGWTRSEAYYYWNIRNRLIFASRNLTQEQARAWRRSAIPAALNVLLIGGRRKFLRPWRPLRVAYRGLRDGRRLAQQQPSAQRPGPTA